MVFKKGHKINLGKKNPKCSETKKRLFKEGILKVWNKGLTKEIDERVKKMSEFRTTWWKKMEGQKRKEIINKTQIKLKQNNLSFYNPINASRAGKIGGRNCAKKHKKNGTGIFSKESRRKANLTQRRNKTAIYSLGAAKRGGINCAKKFKKEQKGAFYNPEINRKIREKINDNYIFMNNKYDSRIECEMAMNIHYQFKIILRYRKNCHVLAGRKEIDFFINGIFIEVHPRIRLREESHEEYYFQRRKALDVNGYEKYPLIVIK